MALGDLTETLSAAPQSDYMDETAIRRKRALAQALMMQGSDTSPIRSPWQGAARLAQGLMGGIHEANADRAEKENNDYNAHLMQGLVGGQSASGNVSPRGGMQPASFIPSSGASAASPQPSGGINSDILTAADKYGIPHNVAMAMARQESSNNPNAPHGGLFQITKGTAANPGYGLQPVNYAALSDPATNADFGMHYLAARNPGINWNDPAAVNKALQSYNGGGDPNYVEHVRRWMGNGSPAPVGAPVQVASSDGNAAFGMAGQPSQPVPSQGQQVADASGGVPAAPAQNSQAQRILAALADPRLRPENKQALMLMYQQATKEDNRPHYSSPHMDAQGNYVQEDQNGQVHVLNASQRAAQAQNHRHVINGNLVDDNGNVIFKAPPTASGLSDEARRIAAEQEAAGDHSWRIGLGRGAQGPETITSVLNQAANGGQKGADRIQNEIDLGGKRSASKTLGAQEANALTAGVEAQNAINIGREASSALPRGNVVPYNTLVQVIQHGTSDPALAKYGQAMATIANTYARAVNPKGLPHEAVVADTLKRLSGAQGPQALNSIFDVMDKEIAQAQQAPAKVRDMMRNEGKSPGGVTNSGVKWTVE